MSDQHQIPIVRGDARHLTFTLGRVVGDRDGEDSRARVEALGFRKESFHGRLQDRDHRLARDAETPGLHRRGNHGEGLAGADLVTEIGVAALKDAPDGILLVLAHRDVRGHAGERQVRSVVFPQADVVLLVVVLSEQALGAIAILPQPLGEADLDLL